MTNEELLQKIIEMEERINLKVNKLETKLSDVFECEIKNQIVQELKIVLNDKNLYIMLNSKMFDDFTKDIETIKIEIENIKGVLPNA